MHVVYLKGYGGFVPYLLVSQANPTIFSGSGGYTVPRRMAINLHGMFPIPLVM